MLPWFPFPEPWPGNALKAISWANQASLCLFSMCQWLGKHPDMQCLENRCFIHSVCFLSCFWEEGKPCPWDSMLAKSQVGVLWMDIPASVFPRRIGQHIYFNCLTVQMLTLPSSTSLIPLTLSKRVTPRPRRPSNKPPAHKSLSFRVSIPESQIYDSHSGANSRTKIF